MRKTISVRLGIYEQVFKNSYKPGVLFMGYRQTIKGLLSKALLIVFFPRFRKKICAFDHLIHVYQSALS